MGLRLAGLCLLFIVSTSYGTIHDSEISDGRLSSSEFLEAETLRDLQNSVAGIGSLSVSADIFRLKKRDVDSQDNSVQNLEEEKHSRISNRSVTVNDAPDICENVPIDAFVTTKDRSTYVFRGEFYWKANGSGIFDGHPRLISKDWDGLPGYIDASMTWPRASTLFFKGKWFWKFVDKHMDPGYPKRISEGLPGIPDYLDAAVVLHGDGKAYFFKGRQYWKYDKYTGVSDGYPRNITNDWIGLPNFLDAAGQYVGNKMSYFFKDDLYYRIIDSTRRVDPVDFGGGKRYPLLIVPEWYSCQSRH